MYGHTNLHANIDSSFSHDCQELEAKGLPQAVRAPA
jgi:hypothetical protein